MDGVDVMWIAVPAGVVTVSDGLATAAGEGSATVTARAGGAEGTAMIDVEQAVASISLEPEFVEFTEIGEQAQLVAEGSDALGSPVPDAGFLWASSDESVVLVDAEGLITARGRGPATVTVSGGAVEAEAAVQVETDDVLVTPEGGTLTSADERVTMMVPPGAVGGETVASITPRPGTLGDPRVLPSSSYEFTPDGLVFTAPILLTIAYDPVELPDGAVEDHLYLVQAEDQGWEVVPQSQVDPVANTATAPVAHFSRYAIRAGDEPPVIQTNALPSGTVGEPYATALQASGGTLPYTWRLASGTLPADVELSASGQLSGTPLSEGMWTFEVEVETADALTDTQELTLEVEASPGPSPDYVSVRLFWRRTACMLTGEGVGYCWGEYTNQDGTYGQLNVPAALPGGLELQQIGGENVPCGVTTVGEVHCWSNGVDDSPSAIPSPLSFVAVENGRPVSATACGLTTGHEIYCWDGGLGWNFASNAHDYVGLSTGTNVGHSCALSGSGQAYCWGSNQYGALGDGSLDPASSEAPALVSGGHTWADITVGDRHTCGVTTEGALHCWGLNDRGQLASGRGDCAVTQFFDCTPEYDHSTVPVPAETAQTFVPGTLSSDPQGSCGLGTDGNGYCWGNLGALGGSPGAGWAPRAIALGSGYVSFSGSLYEWCGVDSLGDAHCGYPPAILPPPDGG